MSKTYINSVANFLVLVDKPQLISQYLTRFLYNASILYVPMARTQRFLDEKGSGLVEELW